MAMNAAVDADQCDSEEKSLEVINLGAGEDVGVIAQLDWVAK